MKLTCLGCQTDYVLSDEAPISEAQCPHCRVPAAQSIPYAPTAVMSPETRPMPNDGSKKSPSRIGRYEILGTAGEGGMGIVYKARHAELNRTVALKVMIAGEHAGEDTIDRFQREARAAAALQHPNIVSVYDVGREHPLYYIVMEYVEGTSLDEISRGPGLHPKEAARMARDLARALHYAHERNIVHRDIKPGNILVDRHGTAKLVDFGLAKSTIDDKTLTKTGEIIGTACYMPPEQASGSMRSVDAKSDIYSLGAVLYQMLTGRAPFSGDTLMAILKQLEEQDPLSPSRLNPEVPRDLETICLKALAKEKPRRYATAEEFAKDLQNFLDGAPIQARPSDLGYRATKWARRHPAASTALVMASVAALVIGAQAYRNFQLQDVGRALPRGLLSLSIALGSQDVPPQWAEARLHYDIARYEIEEKAAKYRAEARAERRQVLEKAVRELDQAIRIHPRYADAYYLRGIALQQLARTEAAALDFDRAILFHAQHADAYYARVLLRLRKLRDRKTRTRSDSDDSDQFFRNERAAIERDIETLKSLHLKPVRALVAEARFTQVTGDPDRALDLADQAVRENRAFADALVVRASIRSELSARRAIPDEKRLRDALADCDDAVGSEPNNAEAYRVRAEIRLILGDYDLAVRDLAEMESIAPDEPQTYIDKALVLGGDPIPGRSTEAIRGAIDRALHLDPKNTTARFRRALLTLESVPAGPPAGKFARAREDLDAALANDPGFQFARVLRMVCDLELGEEPAFESDLESYLQALPPGTKEQRERVRSGIRALVQYLRQRYNITETAAIANEGANLIRRRKLPEAEAKYREVLRRIEDAKILALEGLSPDQCRGLRVTAHYNLACIYSLQNDPDRGIEELEKALQAGYSNFEDLLRDGDLDSVRKHPGFGPLLDRYRK